MGRFDWLGPRGGTVARRLSWDWGESIRVRALRILPLIGAVSLALTLTLLLADSVVAQSPEFVETGADRLFGITVCPDGYAVEGMEVARGRLLCRAYGLGKPDVFADYSTERDGMHACPEGTSWL